MKISTKVALAAVLVGFLGVGIANEYIMPLRKSFQVLDFYCL